MSLILNIDTATESASVGLAREGKEFIARFNTDQKDHASWIQPAIRELIKESGLTVKDLDAVALSGGPGSYTGLRVGMATAKGLCYALNIPLITENTLKVMTLAAVSAIIGTIEKQNTRGMLFCPMIDARRMEVYTALYTDGVKELLPAAAIILATTSFEKELASKPIIFFGSGSAKWKAICRDEHALFANVEYSSKHLGILSYEKFLRNEFAELAYCEPVYLKEFYIHHKN